MIDAILLTAAATLAVSHFGPLAWKWLLTKEPRAASRVLAWEADAKNEWGKLTPEFQAVDAAIMKETKTVLTDIEQTTLANIGAALTAKKEAAVAEKARADQAAADLQTSQAHVTELTGQVGDLAAQLEAEKATTADLSAKLATEQSNHADLANAVSTLAEQAAS